MPVGRGLGLLALLGAGIALYIVLAPRATIADLVPLEKPPAVLADRAQQIIREFGYTDTPVDRASGFVIPPDYPRWLVTTDATTNRWSRDASRKVRRLLFWYRDSPRELEPDSPQTDRLVDRSVVRRDRHVVRRPRHARSAGRVPARAAAARHRGDVAARRAAVGRPVPRRRLVAGRVLRRGARMVAEGFRGHARSVGRPVGGCAGDPGARSRPPATADASCRCTPLDPGRARGRSSR